MSILGPDPQEFGWLTRSREQEFNRMLRQMALSTVVRSQAPGIDPVSAYYTAGPMMRLDPAEQQREQQETMATRPRDYNELIGSARAYMIQDPERYDPDALLRMIEEKRKGNVPVQLSGIAAAAIGVEEMARQNSLLGFTGSASGMIGTLDSWLEVAGRIPFLGDAIARTRGFKAADQWLAEVEEGLKVGFDPRDIGVRKGVSGAVSYAVPATASWRLMGIAGQLPGVAQIGARITPLGRAAIRGLGSEALIEGGGDAPLAERAINVGLGAAFGAGTEMGGYIGRTVTGAGIGAIAGAVASENDPRAMAIGAALGASGGVGFEVFLRRAQRSFPTTETEWWRPWEPRPEGPREWRDVSGFAGSAGSADYNFQRGTMLPEGSFSGVEEPFPQLGTGTPQIPSQSSLGDADWGFPPEQLGGQPQIPPPPPGPRLLSAGEAAKQASQLTKQTTILESPALAPLSRNAQYDDADVAWALVESFPGQVGVVRNVGDVGTTIRRILQDQMPNGVGPQDFRVVTRPVPDFSAPLRHGTQPEAATRIIQNGRFDLTGARRQYEYSEWGPNSVYAARPDSGWLDPQAGGMNIPYRAQVPVTIAPNARTVEVTSIGQMEVIAQSAGFRDSREMMNALWVDGLRSNQVPASQMETSQEAVGRLRGLGIDVLDIKISDEELLAHSAMTDYNPGFTGDQIVGLSADMLMPAISRQTDILVSSGRPITNKMVQEYERHGMFSGQTVMLPEGREGLILEMADGQARVRLMYSDPNDIGTWVSTRDLLPGKVSGLADDIPGLYEDFRTFAEVRLTQQALESGIRPFDIFSPEAATQLPQLMDDYVKTYGLGQVTAKVDSYYAATIKAALEYQHINALRDLAPQIDKTILAAAKEAKAEAEVVGRKLEAKIEDLASARDFDVEKQPGTGFVLVDRLSEGELRVPVDSRDSAVEFLQGFQRETIDDSPATLYPLEMIDSPVGFSETMGRVPGEFADTQHLEDSIEEALEDYSRFRGGGSGGTPPPPPPGLGSLGGAPDPLRLPPTGTERLAAQFQLARRNHPQRYGQLREAMSGLVTDWFMPIRNLTISIDNQLHAMGVTEGNFYSDVAELQNAHTRMMNRAAPWKDRAYAAILPVRTRFVRDGTLWEALNARDEVSDHIMRNAGFNPAERQAVADWRQVMEDFLHQEAMVAYPGMGRQPNYVSWMRQFEAQLPGEGRYQPGEPQWGAERTRGPDESAELEKDVSVIIPRYFDGFFKAVEMGPAYTHLRRRLQAIPTEGPAQLGEVKQALDFWSRSRMWGLDPTHDRVARGLRWMLNKLGKPLGLHFTFDDVMGLSYAGFTTGYRAQLGWQVSPLVRDTPQMFMGGMQVGLDKMLPTFHRYVKDEAYRNQIIERAIDAGWVQRGHQMSVDADMTGSGVWKQNELRETVGPEFAARREQLAGWMDPVQDQLNQSGLGRGVSGTALDPIYGYGKLGDMARAVLGETGYEAAYNALQNYVPMSQNLSGEALRAAKEVLLSESRVGRYQGAIQREFLRLVDAGDFEGAARFFGAEVANSQNIYGMSAHPLAWQGMGPLTGRIGMRWKTFTSQTLANTAQILSDPAISPADRAAYTAQVASMQALFAGAQALTGWNFMRMSLLGSVVGVAGTSLFDLINTIQVAEGRAREMTNQPLTPEQLALVGASGAGYGSTMFTTDPTRASWNPTRGAFRTMEGLRQTIPWGMEATGRFLVTGETGDPWVTRMQRHGLPQGPVQPIQQVGLPYDTRGVPGGMAPQMPPEGWPGGSGAMY